MKLEKGKFYRTRSGEKVECLTTEVKNFSGQCICLLEDGYYELYYIDGRFYDDELSDCDIISEWSDVEIPWEDYPRWCDWVAMDWDGEWHGYVRNPAMGLDKWVKWVNKSIHTTIIIPSEYAPKGFSGDWKESKFERPKKD